MLMESILSVITLNCWGIPFVSKDRSVRMKAIGQELSTGKYDIVSLQEVWTVNDFNEIRDAAKDVLPYSHYFHSGVAGSGLCVLSKYPIHDVLFHKWAVNGYVHKIHHGDWFGGKGVGLCQIHYNDLLINVYTAHLHAEYDVNSYEYAAHRALQAFDTAQFVHVTSGNADVVVLAGDLNTEPDEQALQLLLLSAGLRDACTQNASVGTGLRMLDKTCQGTFGAAQNSYTSASALRSAPDGQRIDYILYRAGAHGRAQVSLESYSLPLPETVPGHSFSYSDHEGVMARLRVSRKAQADHSDASQGEGVGLRSSTARMPRESGENQEGLNRVLESALDTLERALNQVGRDRAYYFAVSVVLTLLLLTALCAPGLGLGLNWGWAAGLVPLITAVLCYTLFMATLWNNMEVNGILAGKLGMLITQDRLRARAGGEGEATESAGAAEDVPDTRL